MPERELFPAVKISHGPATVSEERTAHIFRPECCTGLMYFLVTAGQRTVCISCCRNFNLSHHSDVEWIYDSGY
jgi:hypothetical protein